MKSEVIRVYTKLTVRVVPSCFLLHVVPECNPLLNPISHYFPKVKMPKVNQRNNGENCLSGGWLQLADGGP